VGAILNMAAATLRDDVMKGLQETDASFADAVRKAIFTFGHIPKRIHARDVPKIIRLVEQSVLVTALAAASAKADLADGVDFFLNNMSQRMAQAIREEINARGRVREKDAEAAMNTIVSAIRDLQATGDLILVEENEDDE
jgi:flagellar motor switch protein FliG